MVSALDARSAPAPAAPTPSALHYLDGYVADEAGSRKEIFRDTDPGAFVYVFFQNDAPGRAHRHELKLQAYAPDGQPYGRPLGGTFMVAAGEDMTSRDLPRTVDGTGHNGYLIAGETLSRLPGDVSVDVELDGVKVGQLNFRVRAGGDQLRLVGSFLTNQKGKRRESFSTRDQAVFVYAFFENLVPVQEHVHRFRATFYGPDGSQFGRVLGGDFKIKPGETLAAIDFPRSADPRRHNGFFIDKKLGRRSMGTYRVVLELDDEVVAEHKYRLSAAAGGDRATRR